MKILFAAIGSAGDVYPLIGIAVELQQAGHEVRFITNQDHKVAARRAGLTATGGWYIEDADRKRLSAPNNPNMAKEFMSDIVVQWLPEDTFQVYQCALEFGEVDAIVCNHFCWAAKIAAHRLGVPVFSCTVSPALFRKQIMLEPAEAQAYAKKAMDAVRAVADATAEIPDWMSASDALTRCLWGDCELLLFDQEMLTLNGKTLFFHTVVSAFGHTPRVIGPCWTELSLSESTIELVAKVIAFKAGRKLCVIGFGSWIHDFHSDRIAEQCTLAVLENPDWVVLRLGDGYSTVFSKDRLLSLPHCPLSATKPDLFIGHAGIGTCYQLLANRTTAVHIPFCADQYDNALWMRQNRGDAIVRVEDVTVENIEMAMNVALAYPSKPLHLPKVVNNSGKAAQAIQDWLVMASVTL